MSELWGKAYAAQAAALRTRKQLVDLAKDIESAMAIGEHNQAEMERIAAATTDVNSKFDAIKRSADIETLTKAKGTVKERGDKAIKKMREKIRVDKLVKDREAEKRRKAEEEAERQRKLAEEKARLVESETALAKQRYSEITGGAAIRQLDWVTAKSQLQMLLADFKSAEGVVQVKNEMKKLDVMENAHKVLVRNCKGYVFQKAPLHGKTVQSATDKDLVVVDQGGKGMPKTISWQKFYSEYRANLCELFNKFIRNGRTNGRPKLKGGEWGEAMIGTALMMNFLCSDDASAAEYAGKMLTDALKEGIKFGTGLLDFAKDAFPDFNFAEIEGSAVRDQL